MDVYGNLLPLCNQETLVYDLRNVPGTFAQIIEVRIISKRAECAKHTWPSANCVGNLKQSFYLLPFRLMTDLRLACCVIKMRGNILSGSDNLFNGVNVIEVRTKWFGNFRRFELSRVNLSHRSQNLSELSGVSRNQGF